MKFKLKPNLWIIAYDSLEYFFRIFYTPRKLKMFNPFKWVQYNQVHKVKIPTSFWQTVIESFTQTKRPIHFGLIWVAPGRKMLAGGLTTFCSRFFSDFFFVKVGWLFFRAKVKNGSMIMLSILMWWALTTVQSSWNLTFPFKLTYYRTLHFTAFIILINSFQITENESFELDFGSYGQGSFSRCLLSSTRWFAIKFTPKGKTVN